MSTIHLTIVIITALLVMYADEQGLLWVLGKRERLNHRMLEILHTAIGIGLSLIILTGGLMFVNRSEYLLSNTFFLIKMTFVGALLVNSFAIGSLATIAGDCSYRELTTSQRRRLLISGGVSVVCWIGAIVCGLSL